MVTLTYGGGGGGWGASLLNPSLLVNFTISDLQSPQTSVVNYPQKRPEESGSDRLLFFVL